MRGGGEGGGVCGEEGERDRDFRKEFPRQGPNGEEARSHQECRRQRCESRRVRGSWRRRADDSRFRERTQIRSPCERTVCRRRQKTGALPLEELPLEAQRKNRRGK